MINISLNDPHLLERLAGEMVIWLTTVSSNGTPQPCPVWFYWDGEQVLIYTTPTARKLANIAANPNVALNFEGASVAGGDVMILSGTAAILVEDTYLDPGFVAKYQTAAQKDFATTVEKIHEEYRVLIKIKPQKVRRM